jgi:opacity protein-like surface antigen
MRKFLLLTVALVALTAPVRAADLGTSPLVKAKPSSCTLTNCTGFYVGLNVQEQGGQFSLLSNGLGGLAQNNFAMGIQGGVEIYNGQWRLGFEVGGDYGLSQVGTLPGGGNRKLWSASQLACVGYTLAPLFGGTATPAVDTAGTPVTPSAFPVALANALMSPCVLVGAWERPWGVGFAAGGRASALIAKGWTFDLDALHINYNNANVNPIVSQQTESIVRGGVNYHF